MIFCTLNGLRGTGKEVGYPDKKEVGLQKSAGYRPMRSGKQFSFICACLDPLMEKFQCNIFRYGAKSLQHIRELFRQ